MAGNKAGGMPGLSWYYSVPDKDLKPTLKPDFSVSTTDLFVRTPSAPPVIPNRRPGECGCRWCAAAPEPGVPLGAETALPV